jgi:hypothetical protein
MVSISWKGSLTAAPVDPQIGWMYYNSLLGKTYIWDGSSWNIVSQDGQDGQNGTSPEGFLITWKGGLSSAPSTPQKGWAYYNTSQKKSYIWDGSTWQILAQDGQDGAGGSGSGTYGPWLYVILYTTSGNYTQYNTTVMDTVNFGKVGIGSTARSSTFYIGLIGGESTSFNLTGTPAIQVSGTDANCFTITQPSATSTVTGTYIMDASIAFTPTSAGEKTATITIPNDSPDKPNFSFTVTGLGSIWPKTYDSGEGDGDDAVTCSLTDSQGNLYFVGYGFELVNHHSGSDWWIKKIDSTGNEVVSSWNKKIDFYDNYGSSSDTHDRPTNAIIDNSDNLIVSDGYNTIKWSSNGTEQWRKNVGGTLYADSQNNVFIVTSSSINKYDVAGSSLWTKSGTGKLEFDNSDNIVIFSNDTIRYVTSNGIDNWVKMTGDLDTNVALVNGWYNGTLESDTVDYWKFSLVNGKSYSIMWNDYYGDGTKTAYAYVSAYWEDDKTEVFAQTLNGYSSPKNMVATKSGNIIVKVKPLSSSYTGTYSIRVNEWYSNGSSIIDNWYNESLSTGGSYDYIVPVTQGNRYLISWNSAYEGDNTKTGNVEVSAKWQDDSISIFSSTHGGWTNPKSFIATKTGNIIVNIKTYSSGSSYAGTYGVVVKDLNNVLCQEMGDLLTVNSVTFDLSGNIYIAGYGSKLIDLYSKKDVWIKKYTSTGTEIMSSWNKKLDWGHSDDEYATKIIFDGTNIIVAGQGIDLINGASEDDGWIKKYDVNGSLVSELVIPDSNATLLKIDNIGNHYFSTDSSSYLRMRKYNSSGVLQVILNDKSPYIYYPSFTFDTNNNIYISGYGSNLVTSLSKNDWIIKKFNSAGVEQ